MEDFDAEMVCASVESAGRSEVREFVCVVQLD